MLKLPDVRQGTDYDCGAAALAAVLQFHGLQPGRWLKKMANPVQGMAPDTIEAALWESCGHVVRGTMTIEDLKHFTSTNRPVLCPVTFEGGCGHWVVVRGVAHRKVGFHCPIEGAGAVSFAKWNQIWHDTTPGIAYSNFGVVGWLK